MTLSKNTFFLLLGSLLLLTGCFEIEEKVFLKRDGSGTFSLTIDMHQMKEMMQSMGMDPNDMGEDDPFASMQSDFAEQKAELESIPGVSNARVVTDRDRYSIAVLFDFRDVAALNNGVNKVFEDDAEGAQNIEYYRYSRGTFERTPYFQQAQDVKTEMENSDDMGGMDPSVLFADMAYRTVFEFEQPIKSVSNDNATLSSNNRMVTWDYYFFKPDHQERSVANKIRF